MSESPRRATALAHPNIALAKYWGKQPFGHNLPAVPSLSVTLDGMSTETTVTFDDGLADDELVLNGSPASGTPLARVKGLLDRVREAARVGARARVTSANDFPTASGLASRASAFAALALAASAAAGLSSTPAELSDLARRTSVSSARSVFGGYVELPVGAPGDTYLPASEVAARDHWNLAIVVAVTREGAKDVSSSDGMAHTRATSPYFKGWMESAPETFARVRAALLAKDLRALGEAAEHSALAMHAAALAARPAVLYFTPATVAAIEGVHRLRRDGVTAYATIDAGPHVKVITTLEETDRVAAFMEAVPGVLRTIRTRPGGPARLVASGPTVRSA
ncbi:MAG: diphosphomevalonate decarboxylase [Polyangiaceae bacterium]